MAVGVGPRRARDTLTEAVRSRTIEQLEHEPGHVLLAGLVSPVNHHYQIRRKGRKGGKPTLLAQHGDDVINPALPDEDFEQAVRIAQAEFDRHNPQIVGGSSRSGVVAMTIKSGDANLALLCPAWRKFGTERTVRVSIVFLHSRGDNLIPFSDSIELIRNSGLPASALIEVGNDH